MLAFSYTKSEFVSIDVDKESVPLSLLLCIRTSCGYVRLSYKQRGHPADAPQPGSRLLKQHVFSDATAHMIITPAQGWRYILFFLGFLAAETQKHGLMRVPRSLGRQLVLLRETCMQQAHADLRNW